MKSIFKSAIAMIASAGFVMSALAADPYKVRVQLTEEEDGAMAYLMNYDTKAMIDSVLVADKLALFTGEIEEPVLARVLIDGQSAGAFILESGSIVVEPAQHKIFGSMLNDRMAEYGAKVDELGAKYKAAATDDEREEIYAEYEAIGKQTMEENMDNPLGLYLFVQSASSMEQAEFDAYLAKYPVLKESFIVNNFKSAFEHKSATMPGKMYSDFEVTYDGKTYKLSDYVGKGKYVLVDYWASWCGPCIRQIPVLKELLEEFGDKGLEVLGVAVWDEPDNTLKAIESHGITWPCIINAQRIPTDIYGINGIPCIILYGPDGKILSRDKQGDDLKSDVRAAFDGTLKVD